MTHTPDPAAEIERLRAEVERLRKALERIRAALDDAIRAAATEHSADRRQVASAAGGGWAMGLKDLIERLRGLREEVDGVLRDAVALERQIKDPAWKKSCRIVWQPEGGWDVLSPGGRFWWNPSSCEWWYVREMAHRRGTFRDRAEALIALESYMVTPPEERSES